MIPLNLSDNEFNLFWNESDTTYTGTYSLKEFLNDFSRIFLKLLQNPTSMDDRVQELVDFILAQEATDFIAKVLGPINMQMLFNIQTDFTNVFCHNNNISEENTTHTDFLVLRQDFNTNWLLALTEQATRLTTITSIVMKYEWGLDMEACDKITRTIVNRVEPIKDFIDCYGQDENWYFSGNDNYENPWAKRVIFYIDIENYVLSTLYSLTDEEDAQETLNYIWENAHPVAFTNIAVHPRENLDPFYVFTPEGSKWFNRMTPLFNYLHENHPDVLKKFDEKKAKPHNAIERYVGEFLEAIGYTSDPDMSQAYINEHYYENSRNHTTPIMWHYLNLVRHKNEQDLEFAALPKTWQQNLLLPVID